MVNSFHIEEFFYLELHGVAIKYGGITSTGLIFKAVFTLEKLHLLFALTG